MDYEDVPEILSPEDVGKLIETVEKSPHYWSNDWGSWVLARDRAIIALMYHAALRPRECLSLRFQDIRTDFKIVIRPETNKERSGRLIPLPSAALPYLKQYLSFPRSRFWQGSLYLFPSTENKLNPLASGTWKGRFRRILKDAGFWRPPENSTIPPYRSYTLRISKATHILEKTHDIRCVQAILGHKKLESTARYTKLTPTYQEWMRKAMEC